MRRLFRRSPNGQVRPPGIPRTTIQRRTKEPTQEWSPWLDIDADANLGAPGTGPFEWRCAIVRYLDEHGGVRIESGPGSGMEEYRYKPPENAA